MKHCRNCKYFERAYLHETITGKREQLESGRCNVLLEILKRDNSSLVFVDDLYVAENFGCVLWKARE